MAPGDVTPGRRIWPVRVDEDGGEWFRPEDGDYFYDRKNSAWHATTPNGLAGNLANHDVVEHEDGTITVSPSILVDGSTDGSWHGFLERGVWREV